MAQGNNPAVPLRHGDELSDDDVAMLCDIGDSFPHQLSEAKATRLERLIAGGLVERRQAPDAAPRYRLTPKAETALTARGVGLNEA